MSMKDTLVERLSHAAFHSAGAYDPDDCHDWHETMSKHYRSVLEELRLPYPIQSCSPNGGENTDYLAVVLPDGTEERIPEPEAAGDDYPAEEVVGFILNLPRFRVTKLPKRPRPPRTPKEEMIRLIRKLGAAKTVESLSDAFYSMGWPGTGQQLDEVTRRGSDKRDGRDAARCGDCPHCEQPGRPKACTRRYAAADLKARKAYAAGDSQPRKR